MRISASLIRRRPASIFERVALDRSHPANDNARLSLECLALVTGLSYCGDSMTEIAARHGVTRAAVSKRCVELSRALNLKPSRAMRSISARQSYRRARLKHLSTQV